VYPISLASIGDPIFWGYGPWYTRPAEVRKHASRDLRALVGGREEHCMQKKHVDVEDGLGWVAQYTLLENTLSTIFQAFVSKVASNLQVRRAPD
jgi:hypothetical protein